MRPLHVSIIGAGLGGLCLGQALAQAGIAFDIFERDPAPDSRRQGYRLRIDADGQDALRASLPPARFDLFLQRCAQTLADGQFVDPQLRIAPGRTPTSWRRDTPDEGGDLGADRQVLRDILLGGIAPRVHFGAAFDRFTILGAAAVELGFGDATKTVSTLVVGADGVNSAVRRQLAPAAEPAYTGAVCLYGKTTATAAYDDDLWQGTTIVFADRFAAILDAMRFRAPLPGADDPPRAVEDYLDWAIIGLRCRLGLPLSRTPDLAEQVAAITRDWHPRLKAVFRSSDPSTIAALSVRSARAPAFWPPGPVTLLGDAIHVTSPAGGVGANTALRDARVLADALIDVAAGRRELRAALDRYEAEMRARAACALRASDSAATALSSPTV